MLSRRTLAPIVASLVLGVIAPRAESGAPPLPDRLDYVGYADSILRYEPGYSGGCVPSRPNFVDPEAALGAPDYSGGAYGAGAVSLGSGGLLELYFGGWRLANSGDSRADIHITEIGGYSERCFIALRPVAPTTPQDLIALGLQDANQDGFFEIGASQPAGDIDLDALLSRNVSQLALQFDAVQLVDDITDTPSCTNTVGADIDAVGGAMPWVPVLPLTWGNVKALYRD